MTRLKNLSRKALLDGSAGLILGTVAWFTGTPQVHTATQEYNGSTSVQSPAPPATPEGQTLSTYLVALDKQRHPVTDLKAEELHLFAGKVEQQITSVYSAVKEPLTIGLFFDVSGTRQWDKSVSEEVQMASDFVHSIWHEGDAAFVLAFNYEVHVLAEPTRRLEIVDQALRQVSQSRFNGGTALYDALCSVNPSELASLPGRKVYVVFSDFEDNVSKNTAAQSIKVANEAGASIFSVILGENFGQITSKRRKKLDREQAQSIADETGGEVLVPESKKELAVILQQLKSELQATYRINYVPPSWAAQGNVRKGQKVRVDTSRPHLKLLYPRV